ncbi:MAG: hypothetical protein K6A15_01415 [Treponema sp.]|nr:hypothetical protein [Treponema sp.]
MNKESLSDAKKSIWSIILLILICIFISVLIAISFFSEGKYKLTSPIIITLCLLVMLVLSDTFSSITIFNLIKASRSTYAGIESINENEKEQKIAEQKKEYDEKNKDNHIRIDNDKFTKLILTKYFGKSKDNKIQYDIKIEENDFISNKPIFFDAYLKEGKQETFILIRRNINFSLYFHTLMYVKLNKLLSYMNSRNTKVHLLLLIATADGEENTRQLDSLKEYFSPAQENKLLEIQIINYSDNEFETCIKTEKKNQK